MFDIIEDIIEYFLKKLSLKVRIILLVMLSIVTAYIIVSKR